jgi:hypothetical protein
MKHSPLFFFQNRTHGNQCATGKGLTEIAGFSPEASAVLRLLPVDPVGHAELFKGLGLEGPRAGTTRILKTKGSRPGTRGAFMISGWFMRRPFFLKMVSGWFMVPLG